MDDLSNNEEVFSSSNPKDKKQLKSAKEKTFGFYNVENLFDTIDDPYTIDEQFLPNSDKKWNTEKYTEKLENLSKVIYEMDTNLPMFLGFAEIENKWVLQDLIAQKRLRKGSYGIVHDESPDRRGIDVGLIYQKDYMNVIRIAVARSVMLGVSMKVPWMELALRVTS